TPSATATPAGPIPRLQPSGVSQAATPAGGNPTSASQAPATTGAKSAAAGTPTTKAPAPGQSRTMTQAIGKIEKTPAAPARTTPPGAPPGSKPTATPVGGVPAVNASSAVTPVGGVPASGAKPTATSVGGAPAKAAAPLFGGGAAKPAAPLFGGGPAKPAASSVGGAPAKPTATSVGGAPAPAAAPAGAGTPVSTKTPTGGVPAVSTKMTQAIGAIERIPAVATKPVDSKAETAGWSLPDDFDDVAAQEWKTSPAKAGAPKAGAGTPTPAAGAARPAAASAKPAGPSTPAAGTPKPAVGTTTPAAAIAKQAATRSPSTSFAPEPTDSSSEWLDATVSGAQLALRADEPPDLSVPVDLRGGAPSFTPIAVAAPVLPTVAPAQPEPSNAFRDEPTAPLTAAQNAAIAAEPIVAAIRQQAAPTGPMPFVTQSSVQPHSQPVHAPPMQAPLVAKQPATATPVAPQPAPAHPAAFQAPAPKQQLFDGSRMQRDVATDAHRAIPGSKKPPLLLIGGGVGALALIIFIVMMMRGKDEPKVADAPNKPTPDRVEPVVQPPLPDVVAAVTPDAAEPPPPDDITPVTPKTNPKPNPTGTGKTTNAATPKNPKNPRLRPTKTVPIETVRSELFPRTEADGAKAAKARAAYTTGNQKLFAGDANGAIVAYRQVIALGSASGYRGLGLAYAQQGDTANAVAAFKKYVQMSPTAKDVPLIKKRIAALQGK
nr:hypothetical protein [Deltaproteobacteria bacterium]